jgi:transcriptional regulator with XRE-family HTH domain
MEIRKRREALGWSRKELARRAGIDPSVLQLIELGMSSDDESKVKADHALVEGEKNPPS